VFPETPVPLNVPPEGEPDKVIAPLFIHTGDTGEIETTVSGLTVIEEVVEFVQPLAFI